ncbi:hypothetical protein C8J57DRAFT_1433191 [Mycena rebaudengoi]|nr:hypothetical protein C8J57DRAFT_1433191 [Mycena rebaudengoi]
MDEEDGEWEGEYDEEDDEDIDAEAEEIARRLEAELWADISKANAQAAPPPVPPPVVQETVNSKEQAAVLTVRAILASLESDSLARSTLATSKVPEFDENLLDILRNIGSSGKIPEGVALPISRFLVALARSDVLFGKLRHSDASSIQLKRKREEADENERTPKRPNVGSHPLHVEVSAAVQVISQTISPAQTLGPPLITSIQPQLHRVFLFAVTSSAAGGPNTNALQEISGLIQVLGVLSGIQIGQAPTTESQTISTAVYPCLVSGCGKFFSRLYSLRTHQRVHNEERPFHCDACPATFARNHDLKRHRQLHDRTAWKCGGCDKVFSRRDAIKRHKTSTSVRQPKDECINGQIIEVELPEEVGDEERRTKLWAGSATTGSTADDAEDGEIDATVVSGVQSIVMGLHALLQTHATRALGAPPGQVPSSSLTPNNGQATLASVIARAQLTQAGGAALSGSTNSQSSVATAAPSSSAADPSTASLSMYGLSDEQTKLLEAAINIAATAAQAEAEAQAALEAEEEYDEDEEYEGTGAPPPDPNPIPPPPSLPV